MPKANITSSTIEKKDNTMPSAANLINMISGIYTSPLWEEVRYYASSLGTLRKIQKSIDALQECGKVLRHSASSSLSTTSPTLMCRKPSRAWSLSRTV